LIGRDPRISGDILESAMVAGVCSQGADAVLVGVIPTPGVAFLTTQLGTSAGIVISASHNPVKDNGIKFFGSDGYKLADEVEDDIESYMDVFDDIPRPSGEDVGRMFRRHELVWEYAAHVKSTAKHRLDGIKLVVDCGNGAASELAPYIYSELGAEVHSMNCDPNGININQCCGSLYPEQMQESVRSVGADAGLSFDGDADRVILTDENGQIIDGDRIMAVYATYLAAHGGLPQNRVVATTMSNIGLEVALREHGIELARTSVGDRYVSDEMRRSGAVVGGEKSGHIILSDYTTTGDGMITALQILSIMRDTGKPLSELASVMKEYPQVLLNIPVRQREGWSEIPELKAAIADVESQLAGRGRINVRPSGTEKLIRVMVEGPDQAEVEKLAEQVAEVVREKMG
jgi:phosphoglucosamine mutase